MIFDSSSKKKSANIRIFCCFAVYSLFLIIGAIVFTTTNENLNLVIKTFGEFAFFSSPFILLYSILMAIKNKVSKFIILFCIFGLPSFFYLVVELILTVLGLLV
jgi:hypothetical protein